MRLMLRMYQRLYSQSVGSEPEAGDHTTACCRDHRVVPELLAGVHVADVDLYHGCSQAADAVVQRHAGMGIGSCVEHLSLIHI